jgi:hypothetical protein
MEFTVISNSKRKDIYPKSLRAFSKTCKRISHSLSSSMRPVLSRRYSLEARRLKIL